MEFDVPIYSFMFGVCLWSNYEYLDDATLKIKSSNNEWVDFINITDDLELKAKEEGVNRYHYLFDEGIYGQNSNVMLRPLVIEIREDCVLMI